MLQTLVQALGGNRYPGRGLLLGCGADGRSALAAYFLTGRSVNSRNRVLVSEADGVRTRAFDPALLADPSLILYAPVRRLPGALVVSNGDHTETIAARLLAGGTAEAALDTRTFEPDVPHHTPRIAGVARASGAPWLLAILRRDAAGACERAYFPMERPAPGVGYLIHTYAGDGDPLPPFTGAPRAVRLPQSGARALAETLWAALDADNRVALYACALDAACGVREEWIINRLGDGRSDTGGV